MSHSLPDFRELSVAERLQLVEDIWDSLVEDRPETLGLTAEQCEEVQKRLAAHDHDPASAQPWEQVRDSLFLQEH